jgi:hypothetical protein
MSFRFSRRAAGQARRFVWLGLASAVLAGCGASPELRLHESSEEFLARATPSAQRAAAAKANAAAQYENLAIAARFPEPELSFKTPAFEDGRTSFTTQAELQAILRNTAWASVKDNRRADTIVHLLALGKSQSGVPLEGLMFVRRDLDKPLPSVRDGRPTVMLMGQQHGDEPASAEALLVIAQALSEGGSLNGLLDLINVVVMPRTNPDGAALQQAATANGIDLDRDHLLQQTPEARAVARAMEEFRPVMVLDSHEYAAQPAFLSKFGAESRFDVFVQYATSVNEPEFLTKAAEEWFRAPMLESLRLPGLTAEWSHTTSNAPGDRKVFAGSLQPDTGRNVFGLRNVISLKIETRGAGAGRKGLKRRMQAQLTLMITALRSASARAPDLLKLRKYVENSVRAEACKGQLVLDAKPTVGAYVLPLVDPDSAADKPVSVEWHTPLVQVDPVTRPRPCGYWLAADQTRAVASLRAMGVRVERLGGEAVMQSEVPAAPAAAASAVPASAVTLAPAASAASSPSADADESEEAGEGGGDAKEKASAEAKAEAAPAVKVAATARKTAKAAEAVKDTKAGKDDKPKKKDDVKGTKAAVDKKASGHFTARADSYYVPLSQPLANLVVAVLEPESPVSYLASGLVTARDRQGRVMAVPKGKRTAMP